MKNKIFKMEAEEIFGTAKKYFDLSNQFMHNTSQQEESIEVEKYLRKRIKAKAVVAQLQVTILNNQFHIEGVIIPCNALEQMDPKHIKGMILYILTLSESQAKEDYHIYNHVDADNGSNHNEFDSMLEQFYKNLWGTAYLDSSRDYLREILQKETAEKDVHQNWRLSDSFGPGYYGIGIEEVHKFFDLLDYKKIGVSCNDRGIIYPMNSIVGFYLITDQEDMLPSDDCKSCIGGDSGCAFCRNSRINS